MKRLILMRHAKSDWSDANASDHGRVLNPRGKRSADAMGAWLLKLGYLPDQVLCSDAARTRETLDRLSLGDLPTRLDSDLYLAAPEVIIRALRAATGDCVLMVGHNPGSAFLADMLASEPPSHADFHRFPTAATWVADFDISDWRDLQIGTGLTVNFTVPRDLIK